MPDDDKGWIHTLREFAHASLIVINGLADFLEDVPAVLHGEQHEQKE